MNTIITNANWIRRWLKNRKTWKGHRFCVTAASREYVDEGLSPALAAISAMRIAGGECIPGLAHFGQVEYRDWFDNVFWCLPADQLAAIRAYGFSEVLIDFEPYGLTGKRYPTDLFADAWPLAQDMSGFIDQLRKFKTVYVEQAHPDVILTHLLKLQGVNVVALPNLAKAWPYDGLDEYEWSANAVDWEERHIPAEPVVWAGALRDTPDMAAFREAMDKKFPNRWTFFAGDDSDVPGLREGVTREGYWFYGTEQFEEQWEAAP